MFKLPNRFLLLRFKFFACGVMLAALLLATGLASGQLPKPQKPNSPKKEQKEEEEEPAKTRPKLPPPRVGDEETDEKSSKAGKEEATPETALEREARTAPPATKELFNSLAKPHDLITLRRKDGRWQVEPIPQFVGPTSNAKGSISLKKYNDKWQLGTTLTVKADEITDFKPYEKIALFRVEHFLNSGLEKLPESDERHRSRKDMLHDAGKVLMAVIRFHESARERGARSAGAGWKSAEEELRTQLLSVQLEELQILTTQQDWTAAFGFAIRLAEDYPRDEKVQLAVVRLLAAQAKQPIQEENYREARKRLALLQEQFPDSNALASVREELRKRAAQIVQEAEELANGGKKEDAIARLRVAEEIDPKSPKLHQLFAKLRSTKTPTLYVGVAELPQEMSPARAYTDSEKQAVELVFDSLVKLTSNSATGERYQPGLATGMPRLIILGRQFTLVPDASWSDGRRVTATDVSHTVTLLVSYLPEGASLIDKRGVTLENDAFHINVTLKHGYLDPLSLMDFKILPEALKHANDPEFAKSPTGSGPYSFKGFQGSQAVFAANPHYVTRGGRTVSPAIREIRFFHSKNSVSDFQQDQLHLLLDLPTRKFKELRDLQDVTLKTMQNRRIYFLAVNNRHAPLANVSLRRAIAHAIDRTRILDQCFREGDSNLHRSLNGPYPPGSWACDPQSKPELYRPDLAKSQAEIAKNERVIPSKLTLKYPKVSDDDDPAIENACKAIKDQLKELKITVDLVARTPRELHHDVEVSNDYDLAYYHYDYPSEAYWLWPLFGSGAQNFLGYTNDGELDSLFRKAMTHRQFATVQDLAHQIHMRMNDQMPLIPLWQLDTHIAVSRSLQITGTIDPLLIFNDVENWKLQEK